MEQVNISRDLTKWPRLLVVGDPVTEEQANEILVRTNQWWLSTNDHDWERMIYNLMNVQIDQHNHPKYQDIRAFEEQHRVLNLHYLDNARVVSSWIGGPKGWCDWDGTIGCGNYNIGKWPEVSEVLEDWQMIATAFPFLNLRAQLVPDEGEAQHAAVEFTVHAGEVTCTAEPGELITAPTELSARTVLSILLPRRERGVPFARLKTALEQVRATQSDLP